MPSSRVFDPFPGGGAIALEALRLGCETYANDYNPVAVLILRATLESPQKYGRPFEGIPAGLLAQEEVAAHDDGPQMGLGLEAAPAASAVSRDVNPLLAAAKKWGNYVLGEARKELAAFYTAIPKAQPLSPATEPAPERWKSPEALRRKWWIPSRPRAGRGARPCAPTPPTGHRLCAAVTCPVCGAVMDVNTTCRLFRGQPSFHEEATDDHT